MNGISEKLENHEIKLSTEKLLQLPLEAHDNFDQLWQKAGHPYSFHNRAHIKAVEEAFFIYLNNSTEVNDPLGIREDLERWNHTHQELGNITFDEFKEILRLTIRYHDTGNIAETMEIIDGTLTFRYLTDENGNPKYTATDAEERSKKIIEIAINHSDLDEGKKQRFIALAKHLIEQTKFLLTSENQNTPFARSMRFFDQVGNSLFNENLQMVFGLLEEMVNENPEIEINPYYFFNFTTLRPKELGINDEELNKILQILGKKLPEKNQNYPWEKIKAYDFLNQQRQNHSTEANVN